MINTQFLNFLEDFVSEKRKETFIKVLDNRTRHFTVVLEDIFQPHNASAVVNIRVRFLVMLQKVRRNGWILKSTTNLQQTLKIV